MIKGAPVKTEARAIPGASATTEVQNNILLAAPDPADASVVLLCRSSCMILLPLELCEQGWMAFGLMSSVLVNIFSFIFPS